MDLGAIVLDDFDLDHLPALQRAFAAVAGDFDLSPSTRVAYSNHARLGRRLVVHLDVADPFLWHTEHETFGANLAGAFDDVLPERRPTLTWSVRRERRTDYCVVVRDLYYCVEDEDEADDSGPLQRLASRFDLAPDLLERLLASPTTATHPIAAVAPAGVVETLRAALARPIVPAAPPDAGATVTVYLVDTQREDAERVASRLGLSLGRVLELAWETSKDELYRTTPPVGFPDEQLAPLPPPPTRPLSGVIVPAAAPALPPLPTGEREQAKLALSPPMVDELKALAASADRPIAWCLQRAYALARDRLHAARRD